MFEVYHFIDEAEAIVSKLRVRQCIRTVVSVSLSVYIVQCNKISKSNSDDMHIIFMEFVWLFFTRSSCLSSLSFEMRMMVMCFTRY